MWVDIYNRHKNFIPMKNMFKLDTTDLWFKDTESIINEFNKSSEGVSVSEKEDRLICSFELPGVRKEDISVQYNKSTQHLSVTGKVSNPHIEPSAFNKPKEYKYVVLIGLQYIADKPSLNSVENGMLYLGFDKKQQEKPKDDTINIEIK